MLKALYLREPSLSPTFFDRQSCFRKQIALTGRGFARLDYFPTSDQAS